AEHVAEAFEGVQRAPHELKPFGGRALLAREVAEQALAMRDVLGVAELLEAGARELGVGVRLRHAPDVTQRLGLPAILEGERATAELPLQELEVGERRERLARAVPALLQEVEEQ